LVVRSNFFIGQGLRKKVAGKLTDESKELVRHAADIVDVVSSYIPLKPKGGAFWANCPFHKEKTASFTVNPERQIFKCFGCGKGGDVFSFIQEFEKVGFREALELLAERYNVPLQSHYVGVEQKGPSKTDIHKVNRWATSAFRRALKSDEGENARKYLENRSISEESARSFGLGYAPGGWEYLLDSAKADGISVDSLRAAGLVIDRPDSEGCYDRFRNRLMFPIVDPRGNVVAFGGRTLGDDDVKYINSPETRVFSKSRMLYGLHTARKAAAAEGFIGVVEGYTDVLMPHQVGITNVVATLGTALTADHLLLLGRYTKNVVLVFDGDDAGRRAAEGAVDKFIANTVEIRVALLDSDIDPCEMVVSEGAEAFKEVLHKAIGALAFKVGVVSKRHDMNSASGAARAVDEVAELLASIGDPVRRTLFTRKAAELLKVPESDLLDSVRRRKRFAGTAEDSPLQPARLDGLDRALRYVLQAMLISKALGPMVLEWGMVAEDIADPDLRAIFTVASAWPGDSVKVMGELQGENTKSIAAELLALPMSEEDLRRNLIGAMEFMERRHHEKEAGLAAYRIRDASASGDEEKERLALAELQKKLSRTRLSESRDRQ